MEIGKPPSSIDYWSDHYSKYRYLDPSPFSLFVINNAYIDNEDTVVDLCCGDGRDTNYLQRNCKSIIGVDQACSHNGKGFIRSTVQDYIAKNAPPDITYCRFGFHAMDENVEQDILDWSKCIVAEFRSDVGPRPENDHYRRFINGSKFLYKVLESGFSVKYFCQSYGLSSTEKEDPNLIRFIGKRN